jgi:hypothetical protein
MGTNFKDVLKRNQERSDRADRPKVNWFKLERNETKFIKFLQEFDTDMRNYDSARGTALFLVEHVSPESFSRKALCSFDDEGNCFACEMDKQQPSIGEGEDKKWHPWGQKTNFYVYVIDKEGEISVMSRPTIGKFFDSIVEEIGENNNSLTDLGFKISKGPKNNSPWELKAKDSYDFDLPDVTELTDLSTVVGLKVPYEEQRGFYLPAGKDAPAESEKDASKVGENW